MDQSHRRRLNNGYIHNICNRFSFHSTISLAPCKCCNRSLSGHDSSSHLIGPCDRDMVPRIRCRFVDKVDRFTIQRHELTLETNVPDFGHILLSITPVIFKKKGDRGSCVPVSTVQGHLKNVSTRDWLRNLQDLGWFEF